MSKFTKSEAKKSLLTGLSLVERGPNDFAWAEFAELEDFYSKGYRLVNEDKRQLFEGHRSK